MGNICGKQERDDSVENSRPVGSAAAPKKRTGSNWQGDGRTVGPGPAAAASGGSDSGGSQNPLADRQRRAEAAQSRNQKKAGKLQSQLNQERSKSHNELLNETSAAVVSDRQAAAMAKERRDLES
ncbi:hypothetical protein PWT90_10270 [Aphanocladium album]|nr:hypothetical protein PWT90_10270 [Aphanocladium album]